MNRTFSEDPLISGLGSLRFREISGKIGADKFPARITCNGFRRRVDVGDLAVCINSDERVEACFEKTSVVSIRHPQGLLRLFPFFYLIQQFFVHRRQLRCSFPNAQFQFIMRSPERIFHMLAVGTVPYKSDHLRDLVPIVDPDGPVGPPDAARKTPFRRTSASLAGKALRRLASADHRETPMSGQRS